MALDLENGRTAIFKNDKSDNEKAPDYRGELKTPNGEQFEISLWISESNKGTKYLSGQVSEPYNKETVPPNREADSDDDIPF